jgi:RNA polymerase sigma factor (sigma-70 family)
LNANDKVLIEALRGEDKRKREWALYQLYKDRDLKAFVSSHVRGLGGVQEDVEDVFQEALILFDRNVRSGVFRAESSLKTYFIGIVKWLWLAVMRKKSIKVEEFQPEAIDLQVEGADHIMIAQEKKVIFENVISKMGAQCKELLSLYKLDYSMKEIASLMNFSSPEMAKKQAYRCREKLKSYLTEHKEYLLKFLKN